MLKAVIAAAVLMASTSLANAQLSTAVMLKGNGIGEVIYKAKPCAYEINQTALESYLEQNGLDNPEALNWISMAMEASELNGAPSASECTMAKTTAKKMGILQ